jgi:hypothetical protein
MKPDTAGIPFTIPDQFAGIASIRGVMLVEEDGLRLEYQMRDAFIGLVRSSVSDVMIPFYDIESMEVRRGWRGIRVDVRTRSLRASASIPGQSQHTISVRVRRRDGTRIEASVARVNHRLSELHPQRHDPA